jgi:Flp pilus assembly protein TadD
MGFVNYDDYGPNGYVVDNPNIQAGLTLESLRWALTTTRTGNWHPVTWLSHMLDCQWFGLNPAGHHWISLGFHIVNVLLLFTLMRWLTGSLWKSGLVAALFAWHPLRVESVAWVSERKDVLSGCFFLLTLWAYSLYVRRSRWDQSQEPTRAQVSPQAAWCRSGFFWLAVVFAALGLMSKPMLVTLPLILLAWDFWPLNRTPWLPFGAAPGNADNVGPPKRAASGVKGILFDKVPFLVLSLASSLATMWAQTAGANVFPLERLPWNDRLIHSVLSPVAYLEKAFRPRNLAIFYPYDYTDTSVTGGVLQVMVLLLVSGLCLWRVHRQPYLLVGWSWFLVMLVPVSGLVQAGAQSIADRYTYLPSIGLGILFAWGVADVGSVFRTWRLPLSCMTGGVLVACLLMTRHQLGYWRDSVSLFRHAVEATGGNAMNKFLLANAYWANGDVEEAARAYESILPWMPNSREVRYRLGYIRLQQKRYPEAAAQMREVARIEPTRARAYMCLGYALVHQGQYAAAVDAFVEALLLRPGDEEIRDWLRSAASQAGESQLAASLVEALRSQASPRARLRLAVVRMAQGNFEEALEHCQAALRQDPDNPETLNNLAWLLATSPGAGIRDGARAVEHARRACGLTQFKRAAMVSTLGAAYAEAGRFAEAVAAAQQACALASLAEERDLLERNQSLLKLYSARRAYHAPAVPEDAGGQKGKREG